MSQNLQIEFVTAKFKPLRSRDSFNIIQTKPFKVYLQLKNISNQPIKGLTLKNISLKSASGHDMKYDFEKTFYVDTLNPEEERVIYIDKIGTYAYGLVYLKMEVILADTNTSIKTFQVDPFTRVWSENDGINQWIDFIYIRSKNEYEQSRSNSLLTYLTIISTIIAIASLVVSYTTQWLPKVLENQKSKIEGKEYCLKYKRESWVKVENELYTCAELIKFEISTTSIAH